MVEPPRAVKPEVFGAACPLDHFVPFEPLLGYIQSKSHVAPEHTIRHIGEDLRLVVAGGLALMLFLLIFAMGQIQEIFRALGQ